MKSTFFGAAAIAAALLSAPVVSGAQSTDEKAAPVAATAAKITSHVQQAATPAPADTARGYDSQALRLESHWGDIRIVRGADGPVVGNVGVFRFYNVEKLVASSPVAAAQARVYQANKVPGSIVGMAGLATLVTGIVIASNGSSNASTPIVIVAGGGAIYWSALHLNTAYAALSRAIWWYNRDLAR